MEVRRTLEWLFEVEPQRWQQIVRNCDEEIVRAKIDLESCRNSKLPGGDPRSCLEERKALERARQRLQYAEQKTVAVRKWAQVVQREADEYAGRASQLNTLLDIDLVGAIATLDRVLTSLESYAALRPAGGQSFSASVAPSPPEGVDAAESDVTESGDASAVTPSEVSGDERLGQERLP
jgi:hypothetical protein